MKPSSTVQSSMYPSSYPAANSLALRRPLVEADLRSIDSRIEVPLPDLIDHHLLITATQLGIVHLRHLHAEIVAVHHHREHTVGEAVVAAEVAEEEVQEIENPPTDRAHIRDRGRGAGLIRLGLEVEPRPREEEEEGGIARHLRQELEADLAGGEAQAIAATAVTVVGVAVVVGEEAGTVEEGGNRRIFHAIFKEYPRTELRLAPTQPCCVRHYCILQNFSPCITSFMWIGWSAMVSRRLCARASLSHASTAASIVEFKGPSRDVRMAFLSKPIRRVSACQIALPSISWKIK